MIEMVVVLAVIAILAAILTPIVTSYVDRARNDSAQNDVKKIAAALVQFNTDTKLWPIYTGSSTPTNVNTGAYDVQSTSGNAAVIGTATGWPAAVTGTTSGTLDSVMNSNALNLATTGKTAWKGPYTELGPDPWGTRYYVTSIFLEPGCISTRGGSCVAVGTNGATPSAVFVISAGPNQTLETNFDQATNNFVVNGDDIVARIK